MLRNFMVGFTTATTLGDLFAQTRFLKCLTIGGMQEARSPVAEWSKVPARAI